MNPPKLENPLHSLLLQSLHCSPSEDTLNQFSKLTQQQWTDLTLEAIRLRLPYALDQFLQRNPGMPHLMPQSCHQWLKNWQRNTLLLNLGRQAQLLRMTQICEAEGIPFLLMKGLWIVDQLYQNMAARVSGDIDILLSPDDMPRFTRLLQKQGYPIEQSIGNIRDIAQENNEFSLSTLDGSGRFDIHWSITHPQMESPINEAKIWARASRFVVGGQSCQTPCLEDHLLLMCFHAAIHHRFLYVGPRALVDIAQAVKTPPRPIQWEDLVNRALEMGWDRGVWLMLDLAREHLAVPVPQPVLDTLRPSNACDTAIREAALSAMFIGQQQNEAIGTEVIKLFDKTNWRAWWCHLGRRLFPSPRFILGYFQLSIHDPRLPCLYPWLYLKRWIWMLQNNLPILAKLATDDPKQKRELQRSQTIMRWLGSTSNLPVNQDRIDI